ncbi:MAG: DNRLRE domain-containing protein [Promethearchaeota archaeon]
MRKRIKTRIKTISVIVLIIFCVISFFTWLHFEGYEESLRVVKDAHVTENYPDTNYGSDDYLRVGNYEHYGKVQAFYYFDVSSLPEGWTEAWIYVNFDFGSDVVDVGVIINYENWDETTITWNNMPVESNYVGHILCDGFNFRIPVKSEQIINNGVGVCLYGMGGKADGYIQGYSKEGGRNIATIELSYVGIDPIIFMVLGIVGSIFGIIIGVFALIIRISNKKHREMYKKIKSRNGLDANWIRVNVVNPNVRRNLNRIPANIGNDRPLPKRRNAIPNRHVPIEAFFNRRSYQRDTIPNIEKKINHYITLKLEHGRTMIYVAGKRFIQCIRLILNIPKDNVPIYDEIDSIDEAAKLYSKHIYQNRIIAGHPARLLNQSHSITPEQEFWGHCSNIQAWVEHDYDTRILMSNISFPLLRELSKAGDPTAKIVYKEEIALRLESGYPSVVQYLLTQGYIQAFTPSEFKTILEATNIIKKISSEPKIFSYFLRSCASKFPVLLEDILLEILKLPDGKNILIGSIQTNPRISPFRPYLGFRNFPFLLTLKATLESLFLRIDEKIGEDITECIRIIKNRLEEQGNMTNVAGGGPARNLFLNRRHLGELNDDQKVLLRERFLALARKRLSRCSYCGKEIPKGQDICEWCGHKKDDDDNGFFPYPFLFKPPGGGGGSSKGTIAVKVEIKAYT